MLRPSLALLILGFSCALAHGQSLAPGDRGDQIIEDATADQVVALQAILLLKRLDDDVIVYRSRGEFEEVRQLARVPFATFQRHLKEVSAEVEELASRLPPGRLKSEIRNTLAMYRDGAYWWEKVDQPRVIDFSKLRSNDTGLTLSDRSSAASLPYTVAFHWRQANKHLRRAIKDLRSTIPVRLPTLVGSFFERRNTRLRSVL